MEINQKIYKKLLECELLKNCGTNNFNDYIIKTKDENTNNLYISSAHMKDEIDIYLIKDKEEAVKNISSIKWENLCLELNGNFTEFLFTNFREKYNFWNKYVNELKDNYLPLIIENIELILQEKNYPKIFLDDVMFNLITIFMLDIYSEFYYEGFFENILHVYLSGHLVCGWYGKYPKGKLMVY